MLKKNRMKYDYFEEKLAAGTLVDEICFYFSDDENETEHCFGYMKGYDRPYWAGPCDVQGGCDFETTADMLNAPIYDEQSLKDRWQQVIMCSIVGCSPRNWMKFQGN